MRSVHDSVRSPMDCPECKATEGRPYVATTMLENGGICVGMRCAGCGHEWEIEFPATNSPILVPKPERRRSERA